MATREIRYRSACPQDIYPIRQLLKATDLYFAPIDDHQKWYEQKLRHDPGSLIVAEDGHGIVGMVMFIFDPLLSVVAHLGVYPGYQKHGIGRALFRQALQRIKAKGGHYVAGYVVSSNKVSIKLCKSEGLEAYEKPLTAVFRTLE